MKYLFLLLLCAGATICLAQDTSKKYVLSYNADATIKLDGKLDKSEWKGAKKESGFIFPWTRRKAPATHFFAMVDTHYLYFAFQVKDKNIILQKFTKEADVAQGDRVEIFFAKSPDLKEYYCLEISPDAKVLDYKASFYRNFDDTWNCKGLMVAVKKENNGYAVEGRVTLEELKSLGLFHPLEKGSCFLVGIYRAEYSKGKSDQPLAEWISWIRPNTAEPDFHVPSSFGSFCIAPK